MQLNESQRRAVTCPLGPTLVIAGPGSGKTHVIINRIDYMMTHLGCEGRHILVVTFSKLAAEEMKDRFMNKFGTSSVHFGTLHSIFFRILRRINPKRYQVEKLLLDDKKKGILQHLLKELEIDEDEDFLDGFLKHSSLMKNEMTPLAVYEPNGISKPAYIKLFKAYDSYKERQGFFDFDDMLVDCYYLLKDDQSLLKVVQNQYQYILIDEFQDINKVQFEIIKLLAGEKENIFVVGDDDQSIYQFRGARPEFLLHFKEHFKGAREIFLEINYRSTQHILNSSLALISSNTARFPKELKTPNEMGQPPKIIQCKDTREQALFIVSQISQLKRQGEPLDEIAIIYRTNIEARSIVEALLAGGMPFCLRDGMVSLYDQWMTQDLLSYLYLAHNINDASLALRIINKPKRYMSQKIMKEAQEASDHLFMHLLGDDHLAEWQKNYLQQLLFDLQVLKEKELPEAIRYIRQNIGYDDYVADYAAFRKMSASSLLEVLDEIEDSAKAFTTVEEWEACLKDLAARIKEQSGGRGKAKDTVMLTTMHGSKGLEFNNVFVIDVVDGSIPHHKSDKSGEEEERRLLYVAMTRAKKQLFLLVPGTRYNKDVTPSPFIVEMGQKLLQKHFKKQGMIKHKKLGEGQIIDIIDEQILVVKFNSGQIRKIDSKYCLSNGIISLE